MGSLTLRSQSMNCKSITYNEMGPRMSAESFLTPLLDPAQTQIWVALTNHLVCNVCNLRSLSTFSQSSQEICCSSSISSSASQWKCAMRLPAMYIGYLCGSIWQIIRGKTFSAQFLIGPQSYSCLKLVQGL